MSDDKAAAAPKKKGGLVKKLLLFVLAPLVLIGAGVGGGLYAAGGSGGKDEHHEDPNRPKLQLKGEGHGGGGEHEGPEPAHPDPKTFKSTYYQMEQPFTSNLSDTEGFLQIGLGVSTFYDAKVLDNIKDADMPIRSAVLETLAQQSAETISTPQGKEMLRKLLKEAINKTLEQRTGFGGVDDVYFTSFIVQ